MVSVSKNVCLLGFYVIVLLLLVNLKLRVKDKEHIREYYKVSPIHTSEVQVRSSGTQARHLQETGDSEDDEAEESLLSYIMYFTFIYLVGSMVALVLGSLVSVMSFHPPVSIIWFLLGALMYILQKHTSTGLLSIGISNIGHVPSDVIYMVFLPVLLYEGAVATSWHKFVKMLPSSLVLAYGGVALTSCVLAGLFMATFGEHIASIWEALLLGSSLASTDPVAVISVLKSLKTPEKMTSMFEGESLLNDGTSVAFFQLFRVFVQGNGEDISAGGIVWLVIRLMFLGPIFGGAWGAAACYVVQHFYGLQVFQTMFLLANVYFTFLVAEHYLGLSGPLAAVAFGLYFCARKNIHLESSTVEMHHNVVSTLAAFAESAIFMISGTVALRAADEINFGPAGWLDSFIVYLYMNCARTLLFVLLFPFLRRSIYSVNWRELIILIWGGLRGAIVLSLALTIEDEAGTGYSRKFGDFATFVICISTVFILGINGTAFQPIFRLLNPYPCELFRRVLLCRVMNHIDDLFEEEVEYCCANLLWVTNSCAVDIVPLAKSLVPELKGRRPDRFGRISDTVPSLNKVSRKLQQTMKVATDAKIMRRRPTSTEPEGSSNVAEPRKKELLPMPSVDLSLSVRRTSVSRSFAAAYGAPQELPKWDTSTPLSVGSADSLKYSRVPQAAPEEGRAINRVISHSDTLEDIKDLMDTAKQGTNITSERRERVAGIQLLVTNALRNKYFEYAECGLISGYALQKLERSAYDTQDSVAAVKHRLSRRYRSLACLEATDGVMDCHILETDQDELDDAFDIEWKAIRRNLTSMNIESSSLYWILNKLPKIVFNIMMRRNVERDLQTIVSFVKAHEDLLRDSGADLEDMLSGHLMESYLAQVNQAKAVASEIEAKYSVTFHLTLLRMMAVFFINLKERILKEVASHGVIVKEDQQFIQELIFSKQKRILSNYTAMDYQARVLFSN